MKYVVLKVNGSTEILQREEALELTELQELVGGYIEGLPVENTSTITVMVNEDGLLLNLPANPHCPGLVGNVVLGKTENSEFVGLSDGEMELVKGTWPILAN